jgi:hypothetical protein
MPLNLASVIGAWPELPEAAGDSRFRKSLKLWASADGLPSDFWRNRIEFRSEPVKRSSLFYISRAPELLKKGRVMSILDGAIVNAEPPAG